MEIHRLLQADAVNCKVPVQIFRSRWWCKGEKCVYSQGAGVILILAATGSWQVFDGAVSPGFCAKLERK